MEGYVFTFKLRKNPSDIDIQYEKLLSTDYDFQDVCFGNNRFIAVGGDQSGTENAHLALYSKQSNQIGVITQRQTIIISCAYGDNFLCWYNTDIGRPPYTLWPSAMADGTRTPWMQHRLNDIAFEMVFLLPLEIGRISKNIDGTEWTSDISVETRIFIKSFMNKIALLPSVDLA